VHTANGKVGFSHLLSEPVDLSSSVAENDCLCNCQTFYQRCMHKKREVGSVRVVEITKSIEFPILLLDSYKELLDTLQSQFITLDENPNGVGHEFGSHLQNIVREGSGNYNDLSSGGKVSVDIVNLVLESLVEQLIRLVEN